MTALGFLRKYAFSWFVLLVLSLANLGVARPVQADPGPCTLSLVHSGLITADESWCPSVEPHLINDDVTVQSGVTLTIQAGTTVTARGWKYLIVKGHLDVNGSAANPVMMTGAASDENKVEWGGIFFDGSEGDGSGNISYATIEYAGSNLGGYGGAVHAVLVKDVPDSKAVHIDHSTIRNNRSRGVYVVNSTVQLTNDTFSQNAYPVYIDGAASRISYSGNTFLDNHYGYPNINYPIVEDGIFLGPDAMTGSDFNLPPQTGLDSYVFYSGLNLPAGRTLTIPPGTLVRVGYREGSCRLDIKGHLNAVGTASQPIHITGIPNSGEPLATANEWRGLAFDGSEGGGTGHLAYVTLDTAAADNLPGGYYAVLVQNTSAPGQVLIDNSVIQDNRDIGLRVINGHLTMTGSTLQRNNRPMLITGTNAQASLTGNTFTNNTNNYVYIEPGAMTGNDIHLTLQTGLKAYFLTDTFTLPSGRTLSIDPGVTVRSAGNRFLIVQGNLQALGTTALPVRFSDPDENNYAWGGLIFDGPSGASGHLDHAIIEHGCNWWNGQYCSNVIIYNIAQNRSVVLEHSVIQNSTVTGLQVINSPNAQIDNNLISGGQFGLYIATSMTVQNVAILNPSLDGVGVDTGSTLDARHLTVANSGRTGFYVASGASAGLRNSILSHNALAVKADATGVLNLATNLSDANTTFKSGPVNDTGTITGSAAFEADGYHIQASSSAVGKGISALSVADIDGDARPWPAGSLPDLGADEISAGASAGYQLFLPLAIR